MKRPSAALAISGLFAGATLGFSGPAAAARLGTHTGAALIAALFYPIGFIAAIVTGRRLTSAADSSALTCSNTRRRSTS